MKDVVELLLNWYLENKRELPWRKDRDPYHVWISEVMLQQTRIDAVIDYYKIFMNRIPTIKDLYEISEEELLKLWEGLGYYSRARNLKKAAIVIMDKYNGCFPNTYQDILSLPGIGEYTAGAIASISFNLREVAVDGNVMRVYSRVNGDDFNIGDIKVKKKIGEEIKKILPKNTGEFAQAIMELGEVICIPNGMPKCNSCPLKEKCLAHLKGIENEIPRKIIKKEKKEEKYTVFLLKYDKYYALRKREDGLLKNMWEFPNSNGILNKKTVQNMFAGKVEKAIESSHIFTHKKWIMISYLIEVKEMDSSYRWVPISQIDEEIAVAGAFKPFLDYLKNKFPQ